MKIRKHYMRLLVYPLCMRIFKTLPANPVLNARQRRYLKLLGERGVWTSLYPYFDKREYATFNALRLRGRIWMEYDDTLGGFVARPLESKPIPTPEKDAG